MSGTEDTFLLGADTLLVSRAFFPKKEFPQRRRSDKEDIFKGFFELVGKWVWQWGYGSLKKKVVKQMQNRIKR